jgi:hypothetical protein
MYKIRINFFEKILFMICALVIIIGYFFVYGFIAKEGLSFEALKTMFLWLILIVLLVLTLVCENLRKELKVLTIAHVKETKQLRDDLKRKL